MALPTIDYPNATALVTGGTSGIGAAIAAELADRGVHRLVLVARDEVELRRAAANYDGVTVETVACDLKRREGPDEVAEAVEALGWRVDYLVNNAGIAAMAAFASGEAPAGKSAVDIVDLNVRAVVRLGELFLPGMVERGAGGILFVGSTAADQPVPYRAAYAASKAFVLSLARAVHEEHRDTGVRIACVVPGVTDTNLAGEGAGGEKRGVLEAVSVKEPGEVARVAVDALEASDPARTVGWANRALQAGLAVVPEQVKARAIGKTAQ